MTLKDWYATYCLMFGSAQLYNEWTPEEEKFLSDVAKRRRRGETAMGMIEKFREEHMHELARRNTAVKEIENSAMRAEYYQHLYPRRARRDPKAGKPH